MEKRKETILSPKGYNKMCLIPKKGRKEMFPSAGRILNLARWEGTYFQAVPSHLKCPGGGDGEEIICEDSDQSLLSCKQARWVL